MQFLESKQQQKKWKKVLLVLAVFSCVAAGGAWFASSEDEPVMPQQASLEDRSVHLGLAGLARRLLFQTKDIPPVTVLVLLQNNTELRPGGGFIGAYAVLSFSSDGAKIEVVEGSERLDARTPDTWMPVPPAPIKKYLGVDRWYFRDSNWSPDFGVSAQKALELYRAEGGALAEKIDAVVGITPTVFEEFLDLIGPIFVDGLSFTADSAVETLEYEVEYGFDARGIVFADRKGILESLARELLQQTARFALRDPLHGTKLLIDRVIRLVQQKQIVLFVPDPHTLAALDIDQQLYQEVSGQISEPVGDVVLWVDANLGALKTDHAMERSLSYALAPQAAAHPAERPGFLASASMHYRHTGSFDWRTTRYLTYARLFVPKGSVLVSVNDGGRMLPLPQVDQGEELDMQWFGTFVKIEPGTERTVDFIYRLPDQITEQIEAGRYRLDVIKQIGVLPYELTIDLDFGMTRGSETEERVYRRTMEVAKDVRLEVERITSNQ